MLAMVLYPYVYLLCRAAFLAHSTCQLQQVVGLTIAHVGDGCPGVSAHVDLNFFDRDINCYIALSRRIREA
jgi:hypothetical protein